MPAWSREDPSILQGEAGTPIGCSGGTFFLNCLCSSEIQSRWEQASFHRLLWRTWRKSQLWLLLVGGELHERKRQIQDSELSVPSVVWEAASQMALLTPSLRSHTSCEPLSLSVGWIYWLISNKWNWQKQWHITPKIRLQKDDGFLREHSLVLLDVHLEEASWCALRQPCGQAHVLGAKACQLPHEWVWM